MTKRQIGSGLVTLVGFLGLSCLGPRGLAAQTRGSDFMFHAPRGTLSFNLGYGIPDAGSDIFSEAFDTYTLDKGDFRAPLIGGGLSFFLNERVDLAVEFSYSRSSTWSEYIDWVDDNDLPIEQETRLTRAPLTVSARYFLKDRGREIGSLSWIPATWSPYLGAGGGKMYYRFEQIGDFVDFADLSIFNYSFQSEGWAWVGHVFGGLQWSLSPTWVVSAEARYSLASTDLDRPDFSGYDPIDLSGLSASVGFGLRF